MNIDIEFWILMIVIVTGVVALVDRFFLASKRAASGQYEKPNDYHGWTGLLRSLFPVFLLVLVLRSFLIEPFTIPSSSMEPTLYPGDFVFVNKFTYGLRLPVLRTKIVDISDPKRGDIAVFRFPQDERVNYIKRVVGLPGDRIRYDADKSLFINDQRVSLSDVEVSEDLRIKEATEALPRGSGEPVEHQIRIEMQKSASQGNFQAPFEAIVPEGHYFMMGDNRDNSSDSRMWGFLPERLLVGKAQGIWIHFENWKPTFSRNRLL